jgi:hypothetical protein
MREPMDTDRLGEEAFEFVLKAEETVLEAGRKWAKAVSEVLPAEMPVVRGLVKGAFDFTDEILKAQRELARNLLEVTRPRLTGRTGTRAASRHATPKPRQMHGATPKVTATGARKAS